MTEKRPLTSMMYCKELVVGNMKLGWKGLKEAAAVSIHQFNEAAQSFDERRKSLGSRI